MSVHLQQFFQLCNPEGTRTVDREAFRGLCDRFNIAAREADVIFDDLDHDQDGKISFEDFSRGFSDFISHQESDNDDSSVKGIQSDMTLEDEHQETTTKQHVWTALTAEAERAGMMDSEEGKLKWLLEELHTTDKHHLVSCLETAVEDLLKNLQQLQEEKAQLEDSWKREKREHIKHLKRMEEEMDNQVKETETKMRIKAQADMEDERKSLQSKMDTETDNLQAYLKLVEKVNSWMETQPSDNYDVRLDEVRKKLDDAVHENRQLRMSLLDTQTSIALMRSELLQLRTLYEEKCRELSSEREKIIEFLHEQDHLSRQLNLLHDVNKRLQDTNDALRNTVDLPNHPSKRDVHMCRGKSGSILGDYLEAAYSTSTIDRFAESEEDEDADDERNEPPKAFLRRARSMDINFPYAKKSKDFEKRLVLARKQLNRSDSGVSTAQELEDGYSTTPDSSLPIKEEESGISTVKRGLSVEESGPIRPERPVSLPVPDRIQQECTVNSAQSTPSKDSERERLENRGMPQSASAGSLLETNELPRRKISDIIKQLGIQDQPIKTWTPKRQKSPMTSPQLVTRETETKLMTPPVPLPRRTMTNKTQFQKEPNTGHTVILNGNIHRRASKTWSTDSTITCGTEDVHSIVGESIILEDSEEPFEPNGPAQQTFKVILIGDASVGKSSFALRISKGVFVRHMSSTLSLDFLMRTIRVDGRNVAVQIWDTAGQERFRSITKSYFRKADGVMLLYDCTCEHSFLSVREWVEDVDSITSQRLPLMIVANKIDLRETATESGKRCISTSEGERIAQACDTTFMEASAKNGENVLQALANLVRSMSNHQELQISASTMQLCEAKPKKTSCCGR